ncbi:MAG: NPCBM/NEW2 domain-containing protein, partial [Blastocatellia bacterium]
MSMGINAKAHARLLGIFLLGILLLTGLLAAGFARPGLIIGAAAQEQTGQNDRTRTATLVWLNDLEPLASVEGKRPLENTQRLADIRARRGAALRINGKTYDKGLAMTAYAEARYALGRDFSLFRADIGIGDEAGLQGSAVCQVFLDGTLAWDSGVMNGGAPKKEIAIPVTGKNELRLVVRDAGDGNAFDYAVWGNAALERMTLAGARAAVPAHTHAPGQVDDNHAEYDARLAAAAKDAAPFAAPRQLLTAQGPGDLISLGMWNSVTTWPFVFASAASLPDGRILAWGANNTSSFNGGSTTFAAIWNPATNQITSINHNDHSMFCGIPVMLEDGRVMVTGGDGTRERVSVFDWRTNTWTRAENMNRGRWYPGTVALPNGRVYTALGEPGDVYPEIWTPGQGWTLLTGANLQAPILNFAGHQNNWLPYLHLAPNGRIFHSGPTQQMNWLDHTGNGAVASAGVSNNWYPKYSASVMYDEGKLLVAGGYISGSNQASTNQAAIIDLNGPAPMRTIIPGMASARKFHNAVMLPNGEVLIVGGNTSGIEFNDTGTVLTPEIWNPETRAWRQVADMSVPRNYHSVALLMTDGRVWSGGGGLCNCAADHPNHQVYTPPYLYTATGALAARPAISAAPNATEAGKTISVNATTGIAKFSMIKMSGITHDLNSDLRYLRVPFTTPASGQYQLTLTANRNVLTPGYWMLFAVNSAGVPSVAKVIQVVSSGQPQMATPVTQNNAVGDAVNLPVIASDPTGDPLTYSATGLPAGLGINSQTGVISGTATTGGAYRATVTVSDGALSASVSFDWLVAVRGTIRYVRLEALSEINGNPWTSAAEVSIRDINGTALNRTGWTVTADSQETAGEDGRAVNAIDGSVTSIWHTQWQAASPTHPHWLVIDMKASYNVGGFRYLPRPGGGNGTIADYKFYLSGDGVNWGAPVAQGRFVSDATEKTVTIQANQPPVMAVQANRTNSVGETVNVTINASDPDGATLTWSATGLPAGLTIGASNGVITGAPATAGTYNATVSVADGRGGSASRGFVWT